MRIRFPHERRDEKMTREYVYYPYTFESDPDKFPENIRKMFCENNLVQMNLPHIIKKLIFYSRNKIAEPGVMIRCIDYLMYKFFFPLEANSIFWEMHHEVVGRLLDEERRLFYSLGYLDKGDLYYEVRYSEEPDLNQMYTRLSLYTFFLEWYSDNREGCIKQCAYLAEECFYDIAHLIDEEEKFDPFRGREEIDRLRYLEEITNWISMEAEDGKYGDVVIEFYEQYLDFFKKYKTPKKQKPLFDKLWQTVLKDFKDVLIVLVTDNDVQMEELQEKIDLVSAKDGHYNLLMGECEEQLYLMEGGEEI